jgi:hypothetical protein
MSFHGFASGTGLADFQAESEGAAIACRLPRKRIWFLKAKYRRPESGFGKQTEGVTMKKLFAVLSLLLSLGATASAQETPRVEVFGGYSYLRLEEATPVNGVPAPKRDLNGFLVAGTVNVTGFLGVTGEYSGHFRNGQTIGVINNVDTNFQSYLFGPQIRLFRGRRISPFARVLFGAVRGSIDPSGGSNGIDDTVFGLVAGGGVDVKLTDTFSFRPFTADYLLTRFNSTNQNNLRVSTGVVVNIGKQ